MMNYDEATTAIVHDATTMRRVWRWQLPRLKKAAIHGWACDEPLHPLDVGTWLRPMFGEARIVPLCPFCHEAPSDGCLNGPCPHLRPEIYSREVRAAEGPRR